MAALTVLVVAAGTLASAPREASASAAPVTNAGAPKGDPTSARDEVDVLPAGWRSSDDRLWTLRGDASGLRFYSATASSGYSWTTVAELAEPGSETDNWVGNGCITETGKYAAVVYAPRSYTNDASLTLRGARTAVIDLASGKVTKLPITGAISYYNPGCGAGDSVVFTQLRYLEESGEDSATRLFRVNAAKASTEATIELAGEYSSSVPVANGIVATHGADVVRINAKSKVSKLAHLADPAGHLTVDAGGGIVLLTGSEKSNQVVRLETRKGKQKPQVIASQSGSWLGLQRGTKGRAFVLTEAGADKDLGHGVQRMAANSRSEVSTAGEAWIKPRPWTEKGTPSAEATTATRSSKPVELDVKVKDTGKSVTFSLPTVVRPSSAFDTGAAALPQQNALLNETEPTCGVARNDPGAMALQPSPRGVEWAVDQAVMGNLTVARPANWNQSGLPSWSPQGMFPLPALAGGGHIPPQVLLGIVAQESNMWQTSHALTGEFGNTLIGDYYGRRWVQENNGATWGINYDHADCGYGIGQITDGMRAGQMTPNQQKAIALDYATNIARAAQMLAQKWNELYAAGVIHSDGSSSPIENWFFAAWSYNTGFYAQGENTGDRVDPSHWGVGWLNNPANPRYRPDRGLFHTFEIDAKTPGDWSYPERIMGWAAYPIAKPEGAGYRQAWWVGDAARDDAQPPIDTFCDERNACDATTTARCPAVDSSCWWHAPVTYHDCASGYCGNEVLRFNETYRDKEPKDGDAYEPEYRYPPSCSTSGLPSNARIVDDVPGSYVSPRPCAGTWSNDGSFTIASANPEAKIDLHQIGGGFGGHFWFAHDRDANHYGGPSGQMELTGRWKLSSAIDGGQAEVYVHVPDHGAHTLDAVYEAVTPSGIIPLSIDQAAHETNEWVSIGAVDFGTQIPEVRLSNINEIGTADDDVAWDAIAIAPKRFDPVPDIRVPDPDPTAPDIDYGQQTPSTVSATRSTSSQSTKTVCGEPNERGIKRCATVGPPSTVSSKTASAVAPPHVGALHPWCSSPLPTSLERTRYGSCESKSLTYYWYDLTGKVVASVVFDVVQEVETAQSDGTIREAVTYYPLEYTGGITEVTASAIYTDCEPKCDLSSGVEWRGERTWKVDDHHPVTTTITRTWSGSSGEMDNILLRSRVDIDADGVSNPGPNPPGGASAWVEQANEVRCDYVTPKDKPGCVFRNFVPTMRLNFDRYPAAAAYYWILQEKLETHPGKPGVSTLSRESVSARVIKNRAVVCEQGGSSYMLKGNFHPDATGDDGGRVQCDEYPFARSQQSGGYKYESDPQKGANCATLYAKDLGMHWHIYADQRFGVPTWREICGRASMSGTQNEDAGRDLGRFTSANRLQHDDKYYVSVPELRNCDIDSVCTVDP